MSSVSQIAVATDYSTSWAKPVLALARVGPFDGPPPRDANDPLWRAALKAVEAGAPENALGAVWEDLARGRRRPWCETPPRGGIPPLARLNRTDPTWARAAARVPVRG